MTGTKNTVAATTSVDALVRARHEALTAHVAGPHRMEMVANVNDVVYINDSKATFIDAALDSLVSLEARVIWIAGTWSDDMSEGQVAELLRERVSALVLFGVAAEELPADTGCEVYLADNVPMAVFLARELASPMKWCSSVRHVRAAAVMRITRNVVPISSGPSGNWNKERTPTRA